MRSFTSVEELGERDRRGDRSLRLDHHRPGACQRLRRRHRRPPVDPRRRRAREGQPLRRHDRPRLPHPVAAAALHRRSCSPSTPRAPSSTTAPTRSASPLPAGRLEGPRHRDHRRGQRDQGRHPAGHAVHDRDRGLRQARLRRRDRGPAALLRPGWRRWSARPCRESGGRARRRRSVGTPIRETLGSLARGATREPTTHRRRRRAAGLRLRRARATPAEAAAARTTFVIDTQFISAPSAIVSATGPLSSCTSAVDLEGDGVQTGPRTVLFFGVKELQCARGPSRSPTRPPRTSPADAVRRAPGRSSTRPRRCRERRRTGQGRQRTVHVQAGADGCILDTFRGSVS